ncbi:MAG: purine-nucleoside phosphorylase [Planctomycetota bacterium]
MNTTPTAAVQEARDAILAQKLFQPQVAIVLGSGLGPLADRVDHAFAISYADIPGFPKTHAVGHAGRLVLGFLGGVRVALLQGRAHRYEGWTNAQVAFPTEVLHSLGARTLVTTNAAGGLNARYRVGDLMVIDSHFDWLWRGFHTGTSQEEISEVHSGTNRGTTDCVVRGNSPYDRGLIERVHSIARRHGTVLHQGAYMATLGPTYETRSEYAMFREMGADTVGMSTVPEVLKATSLGMDVLAFSVVTNVASTDVPQSTTHDEVVESGKAAGPKLIAVIEALLDEMSGEPD